MKTFQSDKKVLGYDDDEGSLSGVALILRRFLLTEIGRREFRRHLREEYALENLNFWEDVQRFKKKWASGEGHDDDALRQDGEVIFGRYIPDGAPMQVKYVHRHISTLQNNYPTQCPLQYH